MQPQRRLDLRRRYFSLGTGELTAAAVFTLGILRLAQTWPDAGIALAAASGPMLLVLVVAGAYWLLARSWVGVRLMPRPLALALRALRWALPPLLATGAVVVVLRWPADPWPLVCALLLWALGVVEYVNYFWVRLSYPVSRWFGEVTNWRTPRLMIDVRESMRPVGRENLGTQTHAPHSGVRSVHDQADPQA